MTKDNPSEFHADTDDGLIEREIVLVTAVAGFNVGVEAAEILFKVKAELHAVYAACDVVCINGVAGDCAVDHGCCIELGADAAADHS